jgi:hypothetical protein
LFCGKSCCSTDISITLLLPPLPLLPCVDDTPPQALVVHGERGTIALMISDQAAAAGLAAPRFATHPSAAARPDVGLAIIRRQNHTAALK